MAEINIRVIFSTYIFSLITFGFISSDAGRSSPFSENKAIGVNSNVSKLHFYVHDRAYSTDRTVHEVAQSPTPENFPPRFDRIEIIDHKITAEPDWGSAEIGRLQGTVTTSSMAVLAFTANLNFHFTAGEYKGSTVAAVGRVEVDDLSCEMLVVGGTGLFDSAKGHALGSVYFYDDATSYTIFEFSIYVKSSLQHNFARDIE